MFGLIRFCLECASCELIDANLSDRNSLVVDSTALCAYSGDLYAFSYATNI
jgi:hypothetical protein